MSVRRRTLLKVIVLGDSGYAARLGFICVYVMCGIYIHICLWKFILFSFGFQGWQDVVDESVSFHCSTIGID